eukprot:TRINITY_DN63805_c0_g1_i1.p1 TRINITY_DN63805_c0_g1~~TRINITY_DN63805_c0_g1_i1.p1  ORF type:complete len:223 (+),score=42.91 TRINITY_DN63805_c0_g1_i1:258-926(+)
METRDAAACERLLPVAESNASSDHDEASAAGSKTTAPRTDNDVLMMECIVHILLFCPGHERRSTSRMYRDALDAAWPVHALGPPALPARAVYREAIGTSRAGYGVWVRAHKAVSLETSSRSSRRSGRFGTKWEQTVTSSKVSYGAISEGGTLDSAVSCGFWKATLRLLREAELGKLQAVDPAGPTSGRSVSVCIGGGQEHRLDFLSQDLLYWLKQIEVSLSS